MAQTSDPRIKRRETKTKGTDWHVRTRVNGQPRRATFATKSAAARWLTEQDSGRFTGLGGDPRHRKITVEELAERWLASNPNKRPNTICTDSAALNRILPALKGRKIGGIEPHHVQALVNSWSDLQGRTIKRYYGVLRALFELAVKNDWLPRTPCRGINLPRTERPKHYQLAPSAIQAIAQEMPEQYEPMIWLAAIRGLRWEEVAALRVGSFDFDASTLTVCETVIRDSQGRSLLSSPKSEASARVLHVPGSLLARVRRHMAAQGLTANDQASFLFTDAEGGLLRYSNWRNRVWIPACERAGHPKAGFHGLRRATATALVQSGADPKVAQEVLGHSDSRLTLDIYAQSLPDTHRRAAEATASHIFPRGARQKRATSGRKRRKGKAITSP